MRTHLSSEELVQRVRLCGLVPLAEFDAVVDDLRAGGPPPGIRRVLDRLVADNYLTPFHADRLIVGKYKGFRLGSYVILDRIGSGGMGQVFLAEHASLRRRAAIKVLSVPVGEDEVARERFHREARAAATLDHPNIVRVFDLNQEGQLLYLVMEFVSGVNLQTLVHRAGPADPGTAASYAGQAALGLQHAHEQGLIHRDVKPGNLLVDRTGVCRLLDLGLVRTSNPEDSQLTMNLGGQGGILGTVDYLAPEQAVDSSAVDARADVYALGATLYFLLAGHPMFPDGRAAQKLMWQQSKDPVPIRTVRPEVPVGLAEAVHRAVAKSPADRFQSAAEMATALAPFAVASPPDPEWIAEPPVWRGFGRPTDGGSSVRLGAPPYPSGPPRSGPYLPGLSPTPPRSGVSYLAPNTDIPGGPKSSVVLTAENLAGLTPAAGAGSYTAVSVGDSSILTISDAKKLAQVPDLSTAGPSATAPHRTGVPLPIAIGMMIVSAAVTGLVVWLAVTR